jgi:hypothetical protein
LAFRKWGTWHKGKWALIGALYLFVHAGVEVPGLFGYANDAGDYLAYVFVAIVVSRFSIEEDFARAPVQEHVVQTKRPIHIAPAQLATPWNP